MPVKIDTFAADHLPVSQQPIVMREMWLNPPSEGGAMLRLVLNCTVNELLTEHRTKFMETIYLAQGAVVYCKPCTLETSLASNCVDLQAREETDIWPHTDIVQRDLHAITMISGSHDVGSGCIDKETVAEVCSVDFKNRGGKPLAFEKQIFIGELDKRKVDMLTNSDCGAEYLSGIHDMSIATTDGSFTVHSQNPNAKEFWRLVQEIQDNPEAVKVNRTPDELSGFDQFLCSTQSIFHFKCVPPKGQPADNTGRDKVRLELHPDGSMLGAVRHLHSRRFASYIDNPFA